MSAKFPPHLDAAIAAAYQAGTSPAAIQAEHNISSDGMLGSLRRQGVAIRPRGGTSSVSDATAAKIVADRRSGASYGEIETRYGVARHVIDRIIDAAILKDWDAALSVKEIIRRYGASGGRVDRVRREADRAARERTVNKGKWPEPDELREMIRRDAAACVVVDGFGASSLVGGP